MAAKTPRKPKKPARRAAAAAAAKPRPWKETFQFSLSEAQRRKLAGIFPHPVFLRAKYDPETKKLVITGVTDGATGDFVPSNSAFAR